MKIEVIPLLEGFLETELTAYFLEPTMDHTFLAERPAVILCPGGAYMGITEKEAEPVALRFLAAGYHVFVLKYSIGTEVGRFPAPFIDGARAIKLIRENAKRWYINKDKIVLCGFSTGGHVAAILSSTWQEAYLSEVLQADNQLFKPNALILGYPLLDMYQFREKNANKMKSLLEIMFSNIYGTPNPSDMQLEEWQCKKRVTQNMPPTFLWTTLEDEVIDVKQSLEFARALSKNEVAFELHIFEKGAHGLSLADETVGYDHEEMRKNINAHQWMDMALKWLKPLG